MNTINIDIQEHAFNLPLLASNAGGSGISEAE
jgi:hypothetical protein